MAKGTKEVSKDELKKEILEIITGPTSNKSDRINKGGNAGLDDIHFELKESEIKPDPQKDELGEILTELVKEGTVIIVGKLNHAKFKLARQTKYIIKRKKHSQRVLFFCLKIFYAIILKTFNFINHAINRHYWTPKRWQVYHL